MKVLYDAHLKNKAISKSAHFHYLKWLQYYFDFCGKHHFNQFKKRKCCSFYSKLEGQEPNCSTTKTGISCCIVILRGIGPISFERVDPLKNKDEDLATKKDIFKLMNANWGPVYDGLNSEIR